RDWTPVLGADAIIVGEVTRYGIARGGSPLGVALDTDEPVAVVDVVFEIVDLKTGEVFGTRRIVSRADATSNLADVATRILQQGLGEDGRPARDAAAELLLRARKIAVTTFVNALRPDYRFR